MHPRAREYYMKRDAKDAAIDLAATKQAKADQAKAASNEKAVEAPWTSIKGQESNVAIVTGWIEDVEGLADPKQGLPTFPTTLTRGEFKGS